jgi:protein ImuB
MSRIVSVWLPRWPIRRFLAAQAKAPHTPNPVAPDRPFVLAVTGAGGLHVAALNEAAADLGLAIGESLADARAKAEATEPLQVRSADPAADDAALRRLALWATRYTPTASPWSEADGADGFFLDIEGSAHLFGGEKALLADLAKRLQQNFGLPARLAIADTPGAAWAASRFHSSPAVVLPAGRKAEALAPLPVEALRLSPETRATLRRLGFKTIGSLLDQPRAPFAARFPKELLRRVDQALGRAEELLIPVVAPPLYHSLHYLLEPILTADAVVARASRLMQALARVLARDDAGARALKLSLYRVDGAVECVDIGLTLPTRDVAHVARLIALKLEAVAATEDAGFGFEAIGLAVTVAEPMVARQAALSSTESWGDGGNAERCGALIDALRQRLGADSVRQFAAVASYIPERAEALPPVGDTAPVWPEQKDAEQKPRPLLLLPRAEPAEVMALIPDGPPRRFTFRGVTYDVAGAQGPERIADEWWKHAAPTRDYYLVEDANGHRFWLYREGLYGRETDAARWFVHGMFA